MQQIRQSLPTRKTHPVRRSLPAVQIFNNNVRLIEVAPNGASGHFDAILGNEVLVRSSRVPFLDAARVLQSRGVDGNSWLIGRHAGSETEAVRGKVGILAKLTVSDDRLGQPKFRHLKGPTGDVGALPIARTCAAGSYDPAADFSKSLSEAYRVIRDRVAAGGPTWAPNAGD